MDIKTLNIIKKNPILYNYLRDESYNYKYLYRDPSFLNEIIDLAKEKYKLRSIDKLDRLKDNIDLIQTFLDVLN
jgi:hypothetical protein